MSGLESIAIKILTSTPILVALGGIVLFVILYLLYRRPNPPLSPLYRILLPALRAIALLALVVALLETIVGFDWNISRSRRVAVLIDGSASMDHVELGKSRRARLDSLLSTESYAQWRNDVEVERYYFAGNMTESPSELLTDRTAITDALQALAADPVGGEADSWFLLTDGRSNSGRLFRPQVATALPKVYAVGMSEGAGSIDLAVESLELNPLLYSGVKSEAVVQVRASRATDGPVTLSLKEGDRELASQMIPGIPDDGRATVRLAFTPGVPGDAIYRLVVTPQSGEQNSANNERGVAVTVLKSKHQILIVTQTLDYEIGFLRRKLEGTNKCEIDLRVIG